MKHATSSFRSRIITHAYTYTKKRAEKIVIRENNGFRALRSGRVGGLGVVVIINLGFAAIFTYSMLKFQKREKGLRNMEFGHNWVRQTDHILQGNNAVVNSALKAAETARNVETMKDKVTSLNTASNNNKPLQSPSPMVNARQKSHLDRFESAHERF